MMAREWIIFAICLGLGGHIVLGLILHAPEAWPWREAGTYGLLVGFSVYAVVQLIRMGWWLVRRRQATDIESRGWPA
ncbi:MAG: hypothetical protein FJ246_10035 [Nitrospira sp.]|nr:hypothetical protein [Nitrospira sp.]